MLKNILLFLGSFFALMLLLFSENNEKIQTIENYDFKKTTANPKHNEIIQIEYIEEKPKIKQEKEKNLKEYIIKKIKSYKGQFFIYIYSNERLNLNNKNIVNLNGFIKYQDSIKDFFHLSLPKDSFELAEKIYFKLIYENKIFIANAFRLAEVDLNSPYIWEIEIDISYDSLDIIPIETDKKIEKKIKDLQLPQIKIDEEIFKRFKRIE